MKSTRFVLPGFMTPSPAVRPGNQEADAGKWNQASTRE